MSVSDVAVVGCGRIAWKLENDPLRYKPCTHLGALRYWLKRDRRLRMMALCDSHGENALGAARFLGTDNALLLADFRDAIALGPDLLVIAASTGAHFDILSAALRAEIPRIIVEKPVAFSPAEAKKLSGLLKKSSSLVLPNYERRYHPKYLQLQKRLAGRPHSYRGFFAAGGRSLYAHQKSGDEGVLLHDTTHLLDLAQFFFGGVRRSQSVSGKRKHVLYLEHDNGSAGTIETALGVGAFHLELEIHTARERITVGNGFVDTQAIRQSPHYKNLKSYAAPRRSVDKKFTVAQNPFVKFYERALFGKPDNAHFLEALRNVELLSLP